MPDDYSNSISTAGRIAIGGTVSGNIEYIYDRDLFTASLTAGVSYRLDLMGWSSFNGSLADPCLSIYNASALWLVGDDDSGSGYDSSLVFRPTSSGNYYFQAFSASTTGIGTYRLSLTRVTSTSDTVAADTSSTTTISVGTSVSSAIDSVGDRDWFRASFVAGTTYTIDLMGAGAGNGTLSDSYLRLYDANGSLITTDDDSGSGMDSQLVFTATTSGRYYIAAGGYSDAYAGTYQLRLQTRSSGGSSSEIAGNTTTTSTLAVGGTASSTIDSSGDSDWFRVSLSAGTAYSMDLMGADSGRGTLADPTLTLYDASGSQIASNNNLGYTRDSHLSFTATTTGTYYLGAAAAYGHGTYQLRLTSMGAGISDDIAASTATNASLSAGSSATSTIDSYGDSDWFRTTLTQGYTYTIDLQGMQSGTTGALNDPLLRLYDVYGTQLSYNNAAGQQGAQLVFTATTTGTYYLGAASFGDAWTGGYRLSVTSGTSGGGSGTTDDFTANSATTGTLSVNGGGVSGTIETSDDVDWFRVDLTGGTRYVVRQQGSPSSNGTLGDTYIRGVYDQSGQMVNGTTNDDSNGTTESLVTFTASTSGSYYIAAGGYGTRTGTYRVQISSVGAPIVTTPIADQSVVEGQSFYYLLPSTTFAAQDGGALTYRATQSNGADLPSWLSFNAYSGYFYGTAPVDAYDVTIRVTATDAQQLSVSDEFVLTTPSASGDDFTATTTTTGQAIIGGRTSGTIERAGDVDWFRMTLHAGTTYVIEESGTAGHNGAHAGETLGAPAMSGLYDGSGTVIAGTMPSIFNTANATRLVFQATANGTYYIAAGSAADGIGTYSIYVSEGAANRAPLVSGSIPTRAAPEGNAFSYNIPSYVFSDPDSDRLRLSATLTTGAALPSWLSFDAANSTFFGTPTTGVGDVAVRVTATDPGGLSAYTDFTITTPANIDDYTSTIATTGTLIVGGTASGIIETSGDTDWFSVSLSQGQTYTIDLRRATSGSAILTDPYLRGIFDANGTSIANTTNDDSNGTNDAEVVFAPTTSGTYYISAGAYSAATGAYRLSVTQQSRAPVVAHPLYALDEQEGRSFSWTLASNTFTDPTGQPMTYTATQADGSALPSWLLFNPDNQTLTGTPPTGANDVTVRFTAQNSAGLSASTDMLLRTPVAGGTSASDWTVLVYMDADNNLGQAANATIMLNGLEALHLPTGVNVVLESDGPAASAYGVATGTVRGLVRPDSNRSSFTSPMTSLGELDMGRGQTLTDFINWGTNNYQAQNYALVVFDHGGGLMGTCWDDSSNSDNLTMAELTASIRASNIHTVGLLGFSTCLQGMVEQMDQLRGVADNVIASETVSYGWGDATDFLSVLATNPAISAAQLASRTVSAFDNSPNTYVSRITWTSTNIAAMPTLTARLRDFVQAIVPSSGTGGATVSDWTALLQARSSAFSAYESGASYTQAYVDLGGFLNSMANSTSASANIRQKAASALSAYASVITNLSSATDAAGNSSTGLTVYLPRSSSDYNFSSYNSQNFDFVADTGWDTLVQTMNRHNQAPIVTRSLAPLSTVAGQAFSMVVPDGTFVDPDADQMSYSAVQVINGVTQALPSWLSVDVNTGTVTGTMPLTSQSLITIRETADDGHGGAASTDLVLAPLGVSVVSTVPVLSFTAPTSVTESDSGATLARFIVTLSAPSATPVTVHYRLDQRDGNTYVFRQAQNTVTSSNVAATEGWLTFAANSVSQALDVQINGDTVVEGTERFGVVFDQADGAIFANGARASIVTTSITDNDGGTGSAVTSSLSYTLSDGQISLSLVGSDTSRSRLRSFFLGNPDNINGTGNGSDNFIWGNNGNNILNGAAGADYLDGGDGADTLIGGTGADTLVGGNGSNVFRYNARSEVGDTINDFKTGSDKIAVVSSAFGNLAAGVLDSGNFALDTAQDANDYFIFNTNAGQLYFDADGNGSGAAVMVANLAQHRSLSASDILVVAG